MPSFSTLSLIATLACAAFSSAAPTAAPASIVVAESAVVAGKLDARCDCASVPSILADLTATVTPLTNQLLSLTVETVGTVQPILVDIKVALGVAIGGCKKLAGQSIEVILATEGGVLSVVECGNLVASIVVLIFTALGACLKVLTYVGHGAICALLAEVGCLVAELLHLICGLVGGLLVVVIALIAPIFPIILSLKITSAFAFLGVSLSVL